MVIEIDDFKQPELQAFILEAPNNKTHRLEKCYPVETVDQITSVYDLISQQKVVAGSIIGFNAGTPVRTRGQADQAVAKLTKIAHAYYLDEDDMYRFRNPRTDAERQRIIDSTLMSTAELAQGTRDVKEYIRAGLTYRGKFEYHNSKDDVHIEFDLERPEDNDITAGVAWSDSANATPLDDIELAIEQYRETNANRNPDYIVMTEATYATFKRTAQVKEEALADGTARRVRDEDIRVLFQENGYPTLEIENDYTTFEEVDGSKVDRPHLEDGKVVLHAANMGSTLSGPAVENNFAHGIFAYSKRDDDPVGEKTIVGEVTLPIAKNYNGLVILTVS